MLARRPWRGGEQAQGLREPFATGSGRRQSTAEELVRLDLGRCIAQAAVHSYKCVLLFGLNTFSCLLPGEIKGYAVMEAVGECSIPMSVGRLLTEVLTARAIGFISSLLSILKKH